MTTTATSTEPRMLSGEGVELDVRVARVGSRVPALLIDIIVQIGLLFVLSFVAGLVLAFLGLSGLTPVDGALATAIYGLIVVIALIGYPVAMETLLGGRTVGKLVFGLRVVRDDGGPIRFRHALTRSLVSVALEWPGLILPLVTWVTSLGTMLANPRGKRLGDLAAGTIVIHERSPASWGWVPGMPPVLAGWATTLDLTGLGDDLALAVRHFLARGHGLAEPQRSRLGQALATEVAAATTPHPPPGVPGWAYLAAVLAERNRSGELRKFTAICPVRPTRWSWMFWRSTSRETAVRTTGLVRQGCGALRLERSPSTSVTGSVWLSWIWLTPLEGMVSTRPLPPASMRFSTSSSTST